jgi:hypothetical protein
MAKLNKELKVIELRLVLNNTDKRNTVKVLEGIAEKLDLLVDCPAKKEEQVCAMSGWVGRLESNSDNSMIFKIKETLEGY